jgi:hypothetical protein
LVKRIPCSSITFFYFDQLSNEMKKIVIIICGVLMVSVIKAQELIKVGEDSTINCTGTFIAEVQNYYSNGKPSCKSRTFVDATKDSLIFFTALIDDNRNAHVVFRYAIAKKDVDTGDWGFTVDAVKENGASFQLLRIASTDGNSVVTEEKFAHNIVEKNDNTNRVDIYFNANAQADAKVWAERIKKML